MECQGTKPRAWRKSYRFLFFLFPKWLWMTGISSGAHSTYRIWLICINTKNVDPLFYTFTCIWWSLRPVVGTVVKGLGNLISFCYCCWCLSRHNVSFTCCLCVWVEYVGGGGTWNWFCVTKNKLLGICLNDLQVPSPNSRQSVCFLSPVRTVRITYVEEIERILKCSHAKCISLLRDHIKCNWLGWGQVT